MIFCKKIILDLETYIFVGEIQTNQGQETYEKIQIKVCKLFDFKLILRSKGKLKK